MHRRSVLLEGLNRSWKREIPVLQVSVEWTGEFHASLGCSRSFRFKNELNIQYCIVTVPVQ